VYPKPDRNNYVPNFTKSPENDVIDIGWDEGVLSDGPPFPKECWAQDQVTACTFFFSTQGIEHMTDERCADLLVRERLVTFLAPKRYVVARPLIDAAGHELWSVNVVMGDEESNFASDERQLRPYAKPT